MALQDWAIVKNHVFSEIINLKIFSEFDKLYVHETFLPQDTHQNIIKCCSNFLLKSLNPKILSEENLDLLIEEIVYDEFLENQKQKSKQMNQ